MSSRPYIPILVGIWILILYIGTVPVEHPGNGDALTERWHTEKSEAPVRIQHLLLTPLFKTLDKGLPFLPAMLRLVSINLILGLATLWLIFRLLVCLGSKNSTAAIALALVAFSWVHWEHSIEVESAMVGQFFFLLSVYCLLTGGSSTERTGSLWAGGVSLLFGSLFALNVGFYLPLFLLWILFRDGDIRWNIRGAIRFVLPFLVVWSILGVMGKAVSGPLPGLFHVAHTERLDLGSLISLERAFRSASGLVNGFALSDFGTMARLGLLSSSIPGFTLELSRFLAGALTVVLLVTGIVSLVIRSDRRIGLFLLGGLLVTGIFGYLWLGSDPQFWLPFVGLTPLCVALPLTSMKGRTRRLFLSLFLFLSLTLCGLNYKGRTPSLLSRNGGTEWKTAGETARILPDSMRAVAFRTYVEMTAGSYLRHFIGERFVDGVWWAKNRALSDDKKTLSLEDMLLRERVAFLLPADRLTVRRLAPMLASTPVVGVGEFREVLLKREYKRTSVGDSELFIPPDSR